jgi:hypothetical protein
VLTKKDIGLANNNRHGNLCVAQHYCNLTISIQIPGYWQHGFFIDPDYFPQDELEFAKKYGLKLYVWDEQIGACLLRNNFKNFRIIGAPFIYLPPPEDYTKKSLTANRLLYVPTHSLKQESIKFDWDSTIDYLIDTVGKKYDVTMLLYYLDYSDFNLNERLKFRCASAGIRVETLGYVHDDNFLYKLRTYLMSYDVLGSEIFSTTLIYGAFLGLRVFVGGPTKYVMEMSNSAYFNKFSEHVESYGIYLNQLNQYYQKKYPSFFVHPDESTTNVLVGKQLLGFNYKLKSTEMKIEFGWIGILTFLIQKYISLKSILK